MKYTYYMLIFLRYKGETDGEEAETAANAATTAHRHVPGPGRHAETYDEIAAGRETATADADVHHHVALADRHNRPHRRPLDQASPPPQTT